MILESDEGHRTPRKEKTPPPTAPPNKARATAPAEERRLVQAAQSDPARFEALYELHFDRVYDFVAGRVHDRVTAEDVTSKVFYKALANLKAYEWRGVPFAAWLLPDRRERHRRSLRASVSRTFLARRPPRSWRASRHSRRRTACAVVPTGKPASGNAATRRSRALRRPTKHSGNRGAAG